MATVRVSDRACLNNQLIGENSEMTTERDDSEAKERTSLHFVGTGSCTPAASNDTTCFVLNDRVLIDCGWCAAMSLLQSGRSALDLETVLITHCHHDHYMGLASVFFYRRMQQAQLESEEELRVFGPNEDIERVVERARMYLQMDRFSAVQTTPEVIPVQPGEGFELGELQVRTAPTRHAVQGMAYHFTDTRTGATIGISGDTAYVPELADFFHEVDVLVMEASHGIEDPDPEKASHSSVRQSASIARDAQVGEFYIVHTRIPPSKQAVEPSEAVAEARAIFARSHVPAPRTTLML